MAKTVAKPAKNPAAQDGGSATNSSGKTGGFAFTAALVVALCVALTALPLVLIVAAGMMPTVAVTMIDRRPRYLSYTVGAMNFAGVFPFLLAVAEGPMSMPAAAAKLADPPTWLVMYGAAAAGWLVCGATPMLARAGIELQAFQRRRALEALGKAIREEWGPEVVAEGDR
jgi:hypothetical protein